MTIRITLSSFDELLEEKMFSDTDNVEALEYAESLVTGLPGETVAFWFNRRVLVRWIEGVEYHGQWWI